MKIQNPPPDGRRGAVVKPEFGDLVLRQSRPLGNPFLDELSRFKAELWKCREAFSSDDPAIVKLAAIGAQLLCDDLLEICEEDGGWVTSDALNRAGELVPGSGTHLRSIEGNR